MLKQHWTTFFKGKKSSKPSSFVPHVIDYVRSPMVELGCGSGGDVNAFRASGIRCHGVDQIYGESVEEYIKQHQSPKHVYTRFFWHAIESKLQQQILKWTREWLYIEARTTEDKGRFKVFDDHKRNYVNVPRLVADLKKHKFQIVSLVEGTGFSKFKKEDPHLVRIIARKWKN